MSVQFIIGRAGSGKTRYCLDRITDAMRDQPLGDPILWILPKQATFEAERLLAVGGRLDAFLRCRIISFQELGREVLTECGGAALPEISSYGRQMIIRLLLRDHADELQYFGPSAGQAGLAARIDQTFSDFERAGQTADDLRQLLQQFPAQHDDADAQKLAAKLHDLDLLFTSYIRFIGQDRLDPARRMQQVLQGIATWRGLKNAVVYVDGFLDFSSYERAMLKGIAQVSQSLSITVLGDPSAQAFSSVLSRPHELDCFHRTQHAFQSLSRLFSDEGISIDPPIQLETRYRPASRELARLEQTMALGQASAAPPPTNTTDPDHCKIDDPASVALFEASDRSAEVDLAAMQIKTLLASGYRLRQIAVLMRDLDDYHEQIDASFREHAIPFFADRRRTIAHHPLPQLLRCVLQIALLNWPHEATMTIIKSGLAGLSFTEADDLENYVLEHRIHGSAWVADQNWIYKPSGKRQQQDESGLPIVPADAQRADALRRRLTAHLSPVIKDLAGAEAKPLNLFVRRLCFLLDSLNVRPTLTTWIAQARQEGDLRLAAEHEQVWIELMELFDQMVALIGDQPVTLIDFLELFEAGLEQFDLALTPPTVDQVIVGSVDRTRGHSAKAVIVLGLSDGVFPRSQTEDSILSDNDRRTLRNRNIDIEPDSQRKLLDESLLAYLAFTRASHKLLLLRNITDETGHELAPSPFWQDVRAALPDHVPTSLSDSPQDEPSYIATPRQLVTGLMHWVRQQTEDTHTSTWLALYHWLATHAPISDAVDIMRFRSWKALDYCNRAELTPATIAAAFSVQSPLNLSVRQLETIAECPFKHFATYGLKLRTRSEPDPTALDLSNIYHQTLGKFFDDLHSRQLELANLSDEELSNLAERFTREVATTLREEVMMSNARDQHLLKRIQNSMKQFVQSQQVVFRRYAGQPERTGVFFGGNRSALPALSLQTPAGQKFAVSGYIDRIDRLKGEKAFTVIDYSTSDKSLDFTKVYHGLQLQLLTALLVLRQHTRGVFNQELEPAAGLYARLLRKIKSVDHPDSADSPDTETFHLWGKLKGIINAEFLSELDTTLTAGENSEHLAAGLTKEGTVSRQHSDVVSAESFGQLLDWVCEKLILQADEIIRGGIAVKPYRLGKESPCSWCHYRSVCRFEPNIDGYRFLASAKLEEILQQQPGTEAQTDVDADTDVATNADSSANASASAEATAVKSTQRKHKHKD